MEPIMKWAGGKRQLLNEIKTVINIDELKGHKIIEPFVGGGAFFPLIEKVNSAVNS